MINIQIKGINRLNKFIVELPKNTEKGVMQVSEQFMRNVQKSAKLRAPRRTGELAESITVSKKGKSILCQVFSPYGIFQESGYRGHWVHSGLPTRNSLGTIGNALNFSGFMYLKGSEGKHFMQFALEHNLSNLPNLLQRGINNAIQKSR